MSLITDTTFPVVSRLTPSKQSRLGALRKYVSISYLSSLAWDSLAHAGFIAFGLWRGLSRDEYERSLQIERRKRDLSFKLQALLQATSLHEWLQIAGELDKLEGNKEWKSVDESNEYDHALLRARLDDLEQALRTDDFGALVHIIRTSFSRHLANMTNPDLYTRAHIGTKNLIDLYVTTATNAVSVALEMADKLEFNIAESRFLLEQLQATRQAFGRTALLLSGGATFGMNHTGVVKTLWQMRLLPRVISGSSAGSIVAGVLCAHMDDEIPQILSSFGNGDFSVFESNDGVETLWHRLRRFLISGSFFDIAHLTRVMRDILGDVTFLEAYNRTRRILNITVSHAETHELPRLLNYITAPNIIIWSAIATSCSAPLIFSTSALMAKDPTTGNILEWGESLVQWIDGSVDSDLPMARLSEMFNVNHFIVSQVNPHVIPFVPPGEAVLFAKLSERPREPEPEPVDLPKMLIKEETIGKFTMLSELGVLSNPLSKFASVLRQEYYGDINILPEITYEVFPSMLRNPTPDFMLRACLSGERATWSKLSRIRNHCALEFALDAAVLIMREKVAAAARNANIPLRSVSSYIEENVYTEEDMPEVQQLAPPKKGVHRLKPIRAHSHFDASYQFQRSKGSLHMPEVRRGLKSYAQPYNSIPIKAKRSSSAWIPAITFSGERIRHMPPESGIGASARFRRPSLSYVSSRSERHTPMTLSRRGSFIQSTALPTQRRRARRANTYETSLSTVSLPRLIMAVQTGPPSPVREHEHYRFLRKQSSDSNSNRAVNC
ncbi:conserved hypothetical protein [Coccidioides posadasii str. Silveira]|uniref:Patatin-like phospholipase domain-containing protein n=1 Tax=Coccidioides posadasii (strain RMSCC 757 / Silveira) TaxID=443226 RepID=E9D6F1_COCPS|nr:conserved hypothetical protein [Coccidioides posadasii str. Silveira]